MRSLGTQLVEMQLQGQLSIDVLAEAIDQGISNAITEERRRIAKSLDAEAARILTDHKEEALSMVAAATMLRNLPPVLVCVDEKSFKPQS
jgi:hypothetical protein